MKLKKEWKKGGGDKRMIECKNKNKCTYYHLTRLCDKNNNSCYNKKELAEKIRKEDPRFTYYYKVASNYGGTYNILLCSTDGCLEEAEHIRKGFGNKTLLLCVKCTEDWDKKRLIYLEGLKKE